MRFRQADFYFGLFETRQVPEIFRGVRFISETRGTAADPISVSSQKAAPHTGYWLRHVPSYLHLELLQGYEVIEIPDQTGFAIALEGVRKLENYMSSHLNPRLRGMVRNNPKKLEASGYIARYRYYGEITMERYYFLMAQMKNMLIQRFEEKGTTNERIPEWERLVDLFYPLILDKKASIYEISMDGDPIAIALNYHLRPVLFPAILAYDIQNSRFGLGHMLIADQITWCLDNSYKMIDMSMGDLKYKHDWCNRKYSFSNLLAYNKNSLPVYFGVQFLAFRLRAKRYLKKKGVHLIYHRLRKCLRRG